MPASTSAPSGDTRRQVWRYVRRFPGTQLADIARGAGLAYNHAEYHLRMLERAGLVHRDPDSKAFFPSKGEAVVDRRDRRLLARLRRPTPLMIILALANGAMGAGELAEAVGISRSTLSYQMKQLEKVGALERVQEGRETTVALVDREHIIELLRTHPPTPDTGDSLVGMLDALAEA